MSCKSSITQHTQLIIAFLHASNVWIPTYRKGHKNRSHSESSWQKPSKEDTYECHHNGESEEVITTGRIHCGDVWSCRLSYYHSSLALRKMATKNTPCNEIKIQPNSQPLWIACNGLCDYKFVFTWNGSFHVFVPTVIFIHHVLHRHGAFAGMLGIITSNKFSDRF